jgi:hypothetical protein
MLVVLLPMLLGVFGIGGVQEKSVEERLGPMPMMMQDCPMKLQGTEVTVEGTVTGIALTFTNKPDKVADLRRRVERMAVMHNAERPNEVMMQSQMMAATVNYESIENGARLTLIPKDPAKLAEFRTKVRAHVDRMKNGECPMMQEMMRGMKDHMEKSAAPKPEPGKDGTDHSSHHP